ncbi:MAG: CDP-alcohol phosphatidyltransferase family protein [Bacteroidota bacterium]
MNRGIVGRVSLVDEFFTNKNDTFATSEMKKNIPNIITAINLFCGCCALVSIFYGRFFSAFLFLFVGALADYLDGFVARSLKVKSELGKQLDSLADMVSFGVVPGAIVYMLLVRGMTKNFEGFPQYLMLAGMPAFLITVFAAVRLAKFNIDTRQSEDFIGLNTPACTIFTIGLMLMYHYNSYGLRSLVINPWLLYATIPILSYLLIAELPMFSFKFKNFAWKGNELRFIFLLLSIAFLLLFKEVAFSLIVMLYVLMGIIGILRSNTA